MGDRGPYDMDMVYKDNLNHIVAEQVKFHKSLGRTIILMSGRDESCRNQTEEWLQDLYGVRFDHLYMRKEDDYRKDTIVKKEIYDNQIKGKFNVLAAYDDRISVCKQWAQMDIFTFTVNQGLIEF